MSKRQNGAALLRTLSKEFERICGYDIADADATSRVDAITKARAHIRWYRDDADSVARSMERALKEHMTNSERYSG